MRLLKTALTVLVLAALSGAALADGPDATRRSPRGSIARQLLLKYRLDRIAEGTLVSSLNHNRREWKLLSPDQREQYRNEARAFLAKSPQEQKRLVKHFEKVVKLSAEKRIAYRRRAKWLKVVVASFTPQQRRKLGTLSPQERARRILARRDELVREGKLSFGDPKARPAIAPTTRPAPKAVEAPDPAE